MPLFFKQGMPSDNITAGDGSKVKAGGIIGLPYRTAGSTRDPSDRRRRRAGVEVRVVTTYDSKGVASRPS